MHISKQEYMINLKILYTEIIVWIIRIVFYVVKCVSQSEISINLHSYVTMRDMPNLGKCISIDYTKKHGGQNSKFRTEI